MLGRAIRQITAESRSHTFACGFSSRGKKKRLKSFSHFISPSKNTTDIWPSRKKNSTKRKLRSFFFLLAEHELTASFFSFAWDAPWPEVSHKIVLPVLFLPPVVKQSHLFNWWIFHFPSRSYGRAATVQETWAWSWWWLPSFFGCVCFFHPTVFILRPIKRSSFVRSFDCCCRSISSSFLPSSPPAVRLKGVHLLGKTFAAEILLLNSFPPKKLSFHVRNKVKRRFWGKKWVNHFCDQISKREQNNRVSMDERAKKLQPLTTTIP